MEGRIDYRVEGRILRTTAHGPFNSELIAAIPAAIGALIEKLIQQGKWGHIITFERSALSSMPAFAEFTRYLKARYTDAKTNPVTALVFRADIEGAQSMAGSFLQCYQDAGIESGTFEDYSTAQDWVKARISQTSEIVTWKDSYKIGDATIDEQHQELFRRVANIIAAISHQGQALGVMRLCQYTRTHFSHEEELMRRVNYPDIDSHIRQHQSLISRLDQISLSIANETMVKADLEAFVADWFLKHIAAVDQKLADYVKLK